MNIFSTSECPVQSAIEHNDRHCVKMILECAQLLSTAHFELDGVQVGYKPTHKNHPSAIWARATSGNYDWLYRHFVALCEEFTHRTGKVHKTSELLVLLAKKPYNIPQDDRQEFVLCMPDEYKKKAFDSQTGGLRFSPCKAYQAYLADKFKEWTCRDKPLKIEWSNRNKPSWA